MRGVTVRLGDVRLVIRIWARIMGGLSQVCRLMDFENVWIVRNESKIEFELKCSWMSGSVWWDYNFVEWWENEMWGLKCEVLMLIPQWPCPSCAVKASGLPFMSRRFRNSNEAHPLHLRGETYMSEISEACKSLGICRHAYTTAIRSQWVSMRRNRETKFSLHWRETAGDPPLKMHELCDEVEGIEMRRWGERVVL